MNDYIFKKINGKYNFIGDFDSLYKNIDDPWGQSAKDRKEYLISRERQLRIIDGINNKKNKEEVSILDCGCGLGLTTFHLSKQFSCEGADISSIAIQKARLAYPELTFHVLNLLSNVELTKKYDIVILNNLLWYVIDDLENALLNA